MGKKKKRKKERKEKEKGMFRNNDGFFKCSRAIK